MKIWKLNKDTGFGGPLDGTWIQSNKCIPALMYAPARETDSEGAWIPYVYRPYQPTWRWTGNNRAMLLLEKQDDSGLSLLIERRFVHQISTKDGGSGPDRQSQYEGVFKQNPEGRWLLTVHPASN